MLQKIKFGPAPTTKRFICIDGDKSDPKEIEWQQRSGVDTSWIVDDPPKRNTMPPIPQTPTSLKPSDNPPKRNLLPTIPHPPTPLKLEISLNALKGKCARVKVTAYGKSLICLVDSGSDVSVITKKMLGNAPMKLKPYLGPDIFSASHHKFHVLGVLETHILHGTVGWEIDFVVIEGDLIAPIIGEDWLKQHKVDISYNDLTSTGKVTS